MLRKITAAAERLRAYPFKKDLRSSMLTFCALALPNALAVVFVLSFFELPPSAVIALVVYLALFVAYQFVMRTIILFRNVLPMGEALNIVDTLQSDGSVSSGCDNSYQALHAIMTYTKNISEKQYRLELLQKRAELEALQSQINPHFLYNTLDTIRGKALEEGSVTTSDMIEALSTLLRYTISQREGMVTLGQELKSIDNYMKIQQFRFGNRFSYSSNIENSLPELLNIEIPKMTLQPIVENAIFHGLDPMVSDGRISIEVYSTQSRLILNIEDNGVGMDDERLETLRDKLSEFDPVVASVPPKRGTGIALSNVNTRIKLAFGKQYGLTVFSVKDLGTQFQITLPLTKSHEN